MKDIDKTKQNLRIDKIDVGQRKHLFNKFKEAGGKVLSEKETKEAKQRLKDDGFMGTKDESEDLPEDSETSLVFFNPKSGTEIAFDVNSAFPFPSNPYFEEENSEEHIMHILIDENISTELAMYCIDNCKAKLTFFNEGVGKKYLDDIDFLLRFWKKNNYHTKPSITFTGQSDE